MTSWAKIALNTVRGFSLCALCGLMLLADVATAAPLDISLRGVGRPVPGVQNDPAVNRYRLLSNELVMALAPRPLAPAETLGASGFEFAVVSTWSDISGSKDYWRGQPGSPVFEDFDADVPESFWVPTVHIRKGLPLSTEVGFSASYLARSEMFMLGGELKIAIHESYFRWFPALSARAAFGRLFGASDLDVTTGEIDGIASLPIGIASIAQVTPYIGYGVVFAHVNSEVIDETPFIVRDPDDQRGGPNGSLYNFPTLEWNNNRIGRLFVGARVIVAFAELMYEFDMGFIDNGPSLPSHSLKIGFDI